MRDVKPRSHLNVLMIDDNEDDAILVSEALRDVGYEPTCWRVDTEATLGEALHGQRWDVVLCDVRMPVLRMETALALVRRAVPATAVVLFTGQRPDESEQLMASDTLHGVLVKDRLDDLAALVSGLLSRRRPRFDRHGVPFTAALAAG